MWLTYHSLSLSLKKKCLAALPQQSPVPATILASSGQIRGVQGDASSTIPASSRAVAAMNEGRFRVDSDSELELRERIPDLSSDTMSVPPMDGDESDTDTIDGASEVDASEDVVAPSLRKSLSRWNPDRASWLHHLPVVCRG